MKFTAPLKDTLGLPFIFTAATANSAFLSFVFPSSVYAITSSDRPSIGPESIFVVLRPLPPVSFSAPRPSYIGGRKKGREKVA